METLFVRKALYNQNRPAKLEIPHGAERNRPEIPNMGEQIAWVHLWHNLQIRYYQRSSWCTLQAARGGKHLQATCRFSWEKWQPHIQQNLFISQLTKDILTGNNHPKGYYMEQGNLLYKRRLLLPKSSALIPLLLREYHDGPSGGHSGDLKTYKRIAAEWFWPGIRREIQQYVQACHICQQNKQSTLSPGGLLQPLPIPTQV